MTLLVIFDCDGVLVDSEALSARVWMDMLSEQGIEIDFDHFEAHFLGRSFPKVVANVRREHGIALSDDFEARFRDRLMGHFEHSLQPTPGLTGMLAALGLPACVATSSTPLRAERSLRITGLWDRFAGRVFTASEVARGKPAPDLFLHAASTCGVPPDRCLVIEDSAPGLEAAVAAGMAALHYTGGAHLRDRPRRAACHSDRIADWSELAARCPELFDTQGVA